MTTTDECAWCRRDAKTATVANATTDLSYIEVCADCLPEVLRETPGAKALHETE